MYFAEGPGPDAWRTAYDLLRDFGPAVGLGAVLGLLAGMALASVFKWEGVGAGYYLLALVVGAVAAPVISGAHTKTSPDPLPTPHCSFGYVNGSYGYHCDNTAPP